MTPMLRYLVATHGSRRYIVARSLLGRGWSATRRGGDRVGRALTLHAPIHDAVLLCERDAGAPLKFRLHHADSFAAYVAARETAWSLEEARAVLGVRTVSVPLVKFPVPPAKA